MNPTPLALTGLDLVPPQENEADSVLMENGRISIVGTRAEVARAAPPNTQVLELTGRVLSAGFHDAHFHFLQMGVKSSRPSLRECRSLAEVFEATREAVRRLESPGALILEEWDQSHWAVPELPTRSGLDEVIEDRPIILRRVCDHLAVANTKALELIGRGWNGGGVDPESGLLEEGPVLHLEEIIPPEPGEIGAAFAAAGRLCLSLGITTACDFLRPGACRSYRDFLDMSELPIPVNAFALEECLDRPGLVEGLAANGGFRLRGIKIFADGSIGARTAALFEPYADRPGSRGTLQHSTGELQAAIRRGHDRGMTVAVHAIGDRAIDQVLEAFSTLPPGEAEARGHRVEHFELPGPRDLERLKEVGVRPCVQPNFVGQWGAASGLYETALGAERARRMNPLRSLLRSESGVFFGSDGMPPSPLYGIRSAMNHPVVSERLSWEEALRLYTEAPARALGGEPCEGRIAAGAPADLTVLRPQPHSREERDYDVDLTILSGRIAYRRGSS